METTWFTQTWTLIWAPLKALLIAVLALLSGLLGGCTIKLGNDGEIGFRQCTTWGFFSTAKRTDAISSADSQIPSIEEWIKGRECPICPLPTGSAVGTIEAGATVTPVP